MDSFIGHTISTYTIIDKLGEGGMGVVYKAHDTRLNRVVALKFLPHHLTANEAEQARFLQEAQAAATINHPNVCTIYDIKEEDGQQYIVMEYVAGTTLRALSPVGQVQEALAYAIHIGEALQEAHSKGIVHRDVKADNIMINTRKQVKVMDFGLAKLKGSLKLTRTSSTVGTLAYMAPEQLQGGEVDARSDIFSFGVLLYEMLTGRMPFKGEHEAAVMYSILNEPPDSLLKYRPDLPADLERIIHRALEKDQEDRYQHVDDMVSELRRVQKQSAKVSRPSLSAEVPPASLSTDVTKSSVAAEDTGQPRPGDVGRPPSSDDTPRSPSSAGFSQPPISSEVLRPPLSGEKHPTSLHEAGTGPAGPQRRSRTLLTAGIVGGIAIIAAVAYLLLFPAHRSIDSLAVLPFVNASADPNTEYLSDGITESLINGLSRLSNLTVMSRSSVFHFKGKDIDPREAGRELGVKSVLTGRVMQRGEDLIISAELVDVSTNRHIWGDRYNRKLSDLLSVQEELAQEISTNLKVTLGGEEQKNLTGHPTESTEAYQAYLKGNFHWNKRRADDLLKAAEYYRQAIEIDPNFALAYAGLATAYVLMPEYAYRSPSEVIPRSEAAARKAMALDPSLAEPHAVLGLIKQGFEWDWAGAENEYKKAIELNPRYPTVHHWYCICLRFEGKLDEALAEIKKAQELDPLSLVIIWNVAEIFALKGEYDRAMEQFKKGLELDPNYIGVHVGLGLLYQKQGKFDEAVREYEKVCEIAGASPYGHSMLGYAYARAGREKDALKVLNELLAKAKQGEYLSYDIALVYNGLGDRDKTFTWLDRACEEKHYRVTEMKTQPGWENLYSDPRFIAIMKKVGLQM